MRKKQWFQSLPPLLMALFWLALGIASIFTMSLVIINYDSTEYLPDDMKTKQSLAVMEAEFGLNGQAQVMIGEVDSISEALRYKDAITAIDGVMNILWLDTFIVRDTLIEFDEAIIELGFNLSEFDVTGLNQFYRNHHVLFQVVFEESDHSNKTVSAIQMIRNYLSVIEKPYAMSGSAVSTYFTRTLTEAESLGIMVYILPIVIVILLLFTKSWLEPILFLAVVGFSVLVNIGTNFLLPSVSFLTNSTAMLLQMAIAMDYSIFILHRYRVGKDEGLSLRAALRAARRQSFVPVFSSMLTTAASFVALMFMRYEIGMDMALVMIKGIVISLLAAFTLLPVLIQLFDKRLMNTEHKVWFPKLTGLWKKIFKFRYIITAIILLVAIPAYTSQQKNSFLYGESAISASENTLPHQEIKEIERLFGKHNMIVVLIPVGAETEKQMINEIQSSLKTKNISSTIQAYSTLTDIDTYLGQIPAEIRALAPSVISSEWIADQIPEELIDQLMSENFSRIIISVDTDAESDKAFEAVSTIRSVVPRYFASPDSYHIIGVSSSVLEIKEVVEEDFKIVNLLSIGLVLIILLITFRSIIIPILLVACIELSVWINMAIPYFTGQTIIFIGYLIVGAIQLGATIDYGILLTHNYLNARKQEDKSSAFRTAISSSLHSILTSVMILAAAGYCLYFVSSIEGVAALGELIGRGALLSGFFVLFFLPLLLYFFDGIIEKTTVRAHFFHPSRDTDPLPEDTETQEGE
ncbi:MAG: MMPL family transporter [Candidatus Izemoplasmatales bacterium]|nr:MMPL family transporter [Candidatus Izemoplasmatales bacterium]